MMEKKEKTQSKILVVSELPKQEVSKYKEEDGSEVTLLTKEDAINIILQDVKAIKEAVA